MEVSRFNQGGGDFEVTPAGVHNAVCFAVIDIGTQEGSYMGKPKIAPKIILRWEIDEDTEDGRRFMVQHRYTASMHEKAMLRKHLEAWRGKPFTDAELKPGGFTMDKLLGAGCQLQIVHEEKDGKVYANIAAIMKLAKGQKAIEPSIDPFMLDLESRDTFDKQVWEGLSDNMKDIISKSPEYQAIIRPAATTARAAANGAGKRIAGGMSDEAAAVQHTADLDDEIPF